MLSFDSEDSTVRRQRFNRPLGSVACIHKTSTDLIANLDIELSALFESTDYQQVVWLDFTEVNSVAQQLADVQAVLGGMRRGDVLRVTMNAHASALHPGGGGLSANELLTKRRMKFDHLAGDFMDSAAEDGDFAPDRYPRQILIAIRNAAAAAALYASGLGLYPLQVETYADGQAMASVTGVVLRLDEMVEFVRSTGIENWPFYVSDWEQPERIDVPDLTIRERLLFDQLIAKGVKGRLSRDFPFDRKAAKDLLERYQRYSRYLPQFTHVIY